MAKDVTALARAERRGKRTFPPSEERNAQVGAAGMRTGPGPRRPWVTVLECGRAVGPHEGRQGGRQDPALAGAPFLTPNCQHLFPNLAVLPRYSSAQPQCRETDGNAVSAQTHRNGIQAHAARNGKAITGSASACRTAGGLDASRRPRPGMTGRPERAMGRPLGVSAGRLACIGSRAGQD